MIEFVLAVIMSGWVLATLFIAVIIFDYNDAKFWSGAITLLILTGVYLIFKPIIDAAGWQLVLIFSGVYTIIGVGWSAFKLRRHGKKLVTKYETRSNKTEYNYSQLQEDVGLAENVDSIIYWLLFWPISFIGWVISDAIKWFVTDVMGKFYNWIAKGTLRNVTPIEDTTEDKKNITI